MGKAVRLSPWALVALVAMGCAAYLPIWPNGTGGYTTMSGYVLAWCGSCFKVISAAVIASIFIRHVLQLNLSDIADPLARAVAGLGAAVVMAAFIIAIGMGV